MHVGRRYITKLNIFMFMLGESAW